MRYFVACVRDEAAGVFGRPFFAASRGTAIRSFGDEVKSKAEGNQLSLHPEDFRLFELGTYDDAGATFDLLPVPVLIFSAVDVT